MNQVKQYPVLGRERLDWREPNGILRSAMHRVWTPESGLPEEFYLLDHHPGKGTVRMEITKEEWLRLVNEHGYSVQVAENSAWGDALPGSPDLPVDAG